MRVSPKQKLTASEGFVTAATTVRDAHTNLVAIDWRRLADFYVRVFNCVPVSSVRDHGGPQFDVLTARPGIKARGQHLRLPGHGDHGPTLEIFQFDPHEADLPRELTRPGLDEGESMRAGRWPDTGNRNRGSRGIGAGGRLLRFDGAVFDEDQGSVGMQLASARANSVAEG